MSKGKIKLYILIFCIAKSYMEIEQIAELRLGYSSIMFLEISTRGVLAQILIGPQMSL